MNGHGKVHELALLLPAAGALLLLPPILDIFDVPGTILGLPTLPVYIFLLWLALVLLGARMAFLLDRAAFPPGQNDATHIASDSDPPKGRS